MEITELRPLTIGELLDRTFRLYRNHFWLFVGIMAIPSAVSIPFSVLFRFMSGPTMSGGKPSPTLVLGTIVLVMGFFCFFWAVYSIAIGATTYAVSESYLGQEVTVRGSYAKVWGHFWQILGVVVVTWLRSIGMLILGVIGLMIVIGIFGGVIGQIGPGRSQALTIGGVILGLTCVAGFGLWVVWILRYAVSIPALLLENMGVLAALRRSVQLTRGRRWQILVAVFLCMVVAYTGVIVFQGPFFMATMFSARSGHLPNWLTYGSALSGAIGGAITGPLLMIMLVLCYYDTRIRKEAFDLQFMMSSLDSPAPAPDTPSPA